MKHDTHPASTLPLEWHDLASAAGAAALELTAELFADGSKVERVISVLRDMGHSPAFSSALVTQHQLRIKAEAKFGALAHRLLLTPAGLEQATRQQVAAARAARFAEHFQRVTDLGCGIGAESLAFQAAGLDVHAVEIDALTARFANWNLGVTPGSSHTVTTAAAETVDVGDGAVFVDPARRSGGHRDTRRVALGGYAPSLDFAFDRLSYHGGCVKLGPAFPHEFIPDGLEAQWSSVNGSVVELAVWAGATRRPGVLRAAQVFRDGERFEMAGAADSAAVPVAPLGRYIYDPDGSVIRARLLAKLAAQLHAGLVSDQIAYLTADVAHDSPFAQCFEVLEELPAKEKHLKKALRERHIGSLEIKKRGIDVDPAALRRRLSLSGDTAAVLILTRVGGKHRALLCRRIASSGQ